MVVVFPNEVSRPFVARKAVPATIVSAERPRV